MHAREWSLIEQPRIITKFFGAEGALVGDYEAVYFPVMGHVWTLKHRSEVALSDLDEEGTGDQLTAQDLLAAFVGLCNSEVFVKFLSLYAPSVAGGQFDLSSRHVSPVPVPDLQLLSLNPNTGRTVHELAVFGPFSRPEQRRMATKGGQRSRIPLWRP